MFIESPRFPDDIAYGSVGGPGYSTDIVVLNSGHEQANQNWDQARARYDVSHGVRTQAQLDTLLAFFRAMKGRTHRFRFKDKRDFSATVANGRLGTGAGNGYPAYQLNKYYLTGSLYELRTISKPVVGTVAPFRNAIAVTAGAAAGNYAINNTTGVVTFVADAQSTVTAVTVGVTTQVTLTAALAGLTTSAGSNLLYLSGLTGADAALLNGLAHTITAITGAGLNVYTLATDTAGKTITPAGSGFKYPQTDDALTWSGEFDVPVRFDTDQMNTGLDHYNLYSWNQIPLIEVRV